MLNKEQSSRWKKLQGDKKGLTMNSFYTVVLWIILVITLINGMSASASAQSAIHQIYSGISFLIAMLAFCTLAIRHSKSENIEHIVSVIKKEKKTIGEDKDA